jgi:phage shock protein PspC (stress-responsive transcriptional regulator)
MGETAGGVLRRGSDRILGGVCSGLAAYFGLDVLLVRVVFVILAVAPPGIGIIVYLVLWFLMEPPLGAVTPAPRNVGDRLRAMRNEIREDFRTGFSRASSPSEASRPSPGGSPSSPAAVPSPTPVPPGRWSSSLAGRSRGFWAGLTLIVLGAYFLLVNVGLLAAFRWDLFWPVVLIAIGLLVLFRRR